MSGFMQWFREGRDDLLQALVALPDSIRPTAHPGSFSHPTQMEVNIENKTYEHFLESRQPTVSPPELQHEPEMER